MKLYKVINKDKKAKDGGSFDYTDYLPKGNKPGKWTPKITELKECKTGYHITPYWNMYLSNETDLIFEVECKGLVENNEVGVIDKYVCSQIRFVKQVIVKFSKNWNTGYWNTGDWNTGNRNTGHSNTGDRNTGEWNTGHSNTGDRNTGEWNTGHSNTGYSNTGNSNTGNRNTGNRNTGHSNTGNRNTGYWNTGHSNTGNWNTSNQHVGCFNTKDPQYIELFNKPILKCVYDKIRFTSWLFFDLEKDYKDSFRKAFDKASKEDIQKTIELPNFNYEVFEEISGISKEDFDKKLK